jgi:hypothetical protein
MIRALAVVTIVAGVGCSSSSQSAGAPSSTTSTTGPSAGTLLLSCDHPIGTAAASVSDSCVDYYADQGAEDSALRSAFSMTCTAGGGTVSSSPCSTANSPGGCLIPGSTADPYHDYSVEYFYSPTTEASLRANCASQGDPYVAPGGGTMGIPADAGAADAAAPGSSSGSSGGGSGSGSSSGTPGSGSGGGSSEDVCCQLAPNGTCYCTYTDGGPCVPRNEELTVVGSCSPTACCAVYALSDDAGPAAGATLCTCADNDYINGGGWTCASWVSTFAAGATGMTSSCP